MTFTAQWNISYLICSQLPSIYVDDGFQDFQYYLIYYIYLFLIISVMRSCFYSIEIEMFYHLIKVLDFKLPLYLNIFICF